MKTKQMKEAQQKIQQIRFRCFFGFVLLGVPLTFIIGWFGLIRPILPVVTPPLMSFGFFLIHFLVGFGLMYSVSMTLEIRVLDEVLQSIPESLEQMSEKRAYAYEGSQRPTEWRQERMSS